MKKRYTYGVEGMHCASCEAIVEERLLESGRFAKAEASMADGTVSVECEGEKPKAADLNSLFESGAYTFSDSSAAHRGTPKELLKAAAIASAIIMLISGLSSSGLLPNISIESASSLSAFFLFGLLGGISSCAALVSGLVLSLSSRWMEQHGEKSSTLEKMKPHLLFNSGRIAIYALTGLFFGLLGQTISLSPAVTTIMIVTISLLMIVLALQMLGVEFFNRFRIALPKKIALKSLSGGKRSGTMHPLSTGMLTILLPCGFTMAVEGVAMLSGSPLRGMQVMLAFVLGSTLPLLAISISSLKLSGNARSSNLYQQCAGLIIIFFSIYTLNETLNPADHLSRSGTGRSAASDSAFAALSTAPASTPAPANTTVLKTLYTLQNDIVPSTFETRVGKKVRLVVDSRDNGAGCMSTIMIPGLWEKPLLLEKGKTLILEFTPTKPGAYKITCAMGVPRGVINVK
ncbi:MAG: sulfite exporter TauE/SafE family protein [Chlorobiaceae bacterium]